MEKRCFESFKVFSCQKKRKAEKRKQNPRILSNFWRSFSKKIEKTPSSSIIHSLGGEYCWIVNQSARSNSKYAYTNCYIMFQVLFIQAPRRWLAKTERVGRPHRIKMASIRLRRGRNARIPSAFVIATGRPAKHGWSRYQWTSRLHNNWTDWSKLSILSFVLSLREELTFRDAITGFLVKWPLGNDRRNSSLMTCHFSGLSSA